MKIALVLDSLDAGGVEKAMINLATAIRECGHEAIIVVTERRGEWSDLPQKYRIKVLYLLPNPLKTKYDHAHKIAIALSNFDACLLNHCRVAQSIIGKLPKSVCVISVLHNLHSSIFEVGLANSSALDGVICVGHALATEASKYNLNAIPVKVIPNGVPITTVKRDAFSNKKKISIVYIGRLEHKQKGVLYLPEIIKNLLNLGVEFQFTIVGDGPDMPELKSRLIDYKEYVTFTGMRNPIDTMKILDASDILILPSHFEGQGLVLVEAMSRGIIPVASKILGVTDKIINNDVDGFLVDAKEIYNYAKIINRLFLNPSLVDEISRNAIQSASINFNINNTSLEYLDFIKFSLGRHQLRDNQIGYELLGKIPSTPIIIKKILIIGRKIMKNIL